MKGQEEQVDMGKKFLILAMKGASLGTSQAEKGGGEHSNYKKAQLSISIYSYGTWFAPTCCASLMMPQCTCLNLQAYRIILCSVPDRRPENELWRSKRVKDIDCQLLN